MAADDLMKIRITADFKEAEGAFLKMAKVATAFESDFRRIAGGLNKEFNKINGMAKLFGNSTNVVKDKMDALKRSMEQLMTLGLQPMNPEVQKLKKQYDKLAASITHSTQETTKVAKTTKDAGKSVQKSNRQWTNFALVLQDLPYGFRGIQNNLPAVLGGIAGVAGPLYLVGSAVIAFFTAWDNGMISFGKSTKLAEDYTKKFAETLTQETVKFQSLYRVATDVNTSMNERIKAAKLLKEEYPGLLTQYSEEEIALGKAKVAFDKLSASVIKYAKAQAAISIVTDLTKEQLIIEGERAELLDKFVKDPLTNYSKAERANRKGASPYNVALTYRVNILKQLANKYNDLQKKIDVYTKVLDKNATAESDLNDAKNKPGSTTGSPKDSYFLDSLRAKQKAYKDDIYAFRAYGILIINEEERLAVERAKTDGTYLQNKKDLHARYDADRLTNNNLFEEKLNKVLDDNAKIRTAQEKKELDIQVANRLAIANAILAINKQFAEDNLRNAILFAKNQTKIIETELAVQDKLNRNNLTNRIQFTEEALAKLVALAAFTFDPKVLAVYLDAIDKITAKLKGLGGTWEETTRAIDSIIKSFMANSLFALGESIGKVFAGETVDAIDVFGTLIADALQALGKQLIAFGVAKLAAFEALKSGTPAGAALAIAAGLAAVAAGAQMKSMITRTSSGRNTPAGNIPAFANGGIISGPTMGLMGEYPGAKSNPEVVAPLDKLKDMLGGGQGGTFVLRGQDLLLSVNRAQKASSIKGQTISLA
jgi:hypothetical protein